MPPSLEQPVDPRRGSPLLATIAADGVESSSKPKTTTTVEGVVEHVSKVDSAEEEEERMRNERRQLDRFGAHCRTFYESSVSVRSGLVVVAPRRERGSSLSGGRSRESSPTAASASVARSVLAAFDAACHGGGVDPVVNATEDDEEAEEIRIAIERCGLSDPSSFRPELRSTYSSVRDDARREVHADQARRRADRLGFLLAEREAALEDVDEEEGDDDDGNEGTTRRVEVKQGGWTGTVRTLSSTSSLSRKRRRRNDERRPFSVRNARKLARAFGSKYVKNVGCHPFLAGLRRLIERQVSRDDRGKVLVWTFSGLTLTENCFGGEDNGDGDGDSYAVDAIDLLLSFLRRSSTNEEEATSTDAETEKEASPEEDAEEGRCRNDERLSWEVRPNVSDRDLRTVLRALLPRATDLHGRPTGEVAVSNRRRRREVPTNDGVSLAFLKLWKRFQTNFLLRGMRRFFGDWLKLGAAADDEDGGGARRRVVGRDVAADGGDKLQIV